MKFNLLLFTTALSAVIIACTNPPTGPDATSPETTPPPPMEKGVLSITATTELGTDTYDRVIAELKASGEWVNDWNYHAIGTMQPKGFFSIGVYPTQAAFDHRRSVFKDLFMKLGINAPAPAVHQVHNVIAGAQPAAMPAGAFIASFAQANMSPTAYADILTELGAKGQGAPSGRIYHVSYVTETGVQVLDVWESEAQFKAFGAVLMPVLAGKGISAQPTMYPLYNSWSMQ